MIFKCFSESNREHDDDPLPAPDCGDGRPRRLYPQADGAPGRHPHLRQHGRHLVACGVVG